MLTSTWRHVTYVAFKRPSLQGRPEDHKLCGREQDQEVRTSSCIEPLSLKTGTRKRILGELNQRIQWLERRHMPQKKNITVTAIFSNKSCIRVWLVKFTAQSGSCPKPTGMDLNQDVYMTSSLVISCWIQTAESVASITLRTIDMVWLQRLHHVPCFLSYSIWALEEQKSHVNRTQSFRSDIRMHWHFSILPLSYVNCCCDGVVAFCLNNHGMLYHGRKVAFKPYCGIPDVSLWEPISVCFSKKMHTAICLRKVRVSLQIISMLPSVSEGRAIDGIYMVGVLEVFRGKSVAAGAAKYTDSLVHAVLKAYDRSCSDATESTDLFASSI